MSLKLYFAPGACSFVPHALLEMAGAAFEPVGIKLHKGEQQSAEYLALNPRGQVPVLVDGDTVITQIVAIVQHLDQILPSANLLPKSGMARSKLLETFIWMNNTVHPTFTHFFMPGKYTDDSQAQAAIKAHAVGTYRKALGEIEAMAQNASPWLTGEQAGVLDAYALTFLRWGGFAGIDPNEFPATWKLVQAFAEIPAVARVIERERLKLNVYQPTA
jgi:glutathione S-transferase